MSSCGNTEVPTAERVRRRSGQSNTARMHKTSKDSPRVAGHTLKAKEIEKETTDDDQYVSRKDRKSLAGDAHGLSGRKRNIVETGVRNVGHKGGRPPCSKKKMVVDEINESDSDSREYYYHSPSGSADTVDKGTTRRSKRCYKMTECDVVGDKDIQDDKMTGLEDSLTDGEDNITLDVSCTDSVVGGNQDKARKTSPRYRCNLHGVISDICSLNLREDHLNAIRRTPCWYFVEAALQMGMSEHASYKKCDATIAEIVKLSVSNRYNETRGFQFGETVLCPVREDFKLTFGIRDGRLPIKSGSLGEYDFVRRCWPYMEGRSFHVTKTIVLSVLLEKIAIQDDDDHVVEDVARLVFIYLLATLFIPNPNYRVPWTAMKYLDDFDAICRYDWCTFMLEGLMKGIQKTVNLHVQNCSIFLLFWFCEVCPIIPPRNNGIHFPRFRKWSLVEMKNKFAKLDLQNLDKTYVLRKEFLVQRRELRYLEGKYPRVVEKPKTGQRTANNSQTVDMSEASKSDDNVADSSHNDGLISRQESALVNDHCGNAGGKNIVEIDQPKLPQQEGMSEPPADTNAGSSVILDNVGPLPTPDDNGRIDNVSEMDHESKDFNWTSFMNNNVNGLGGVLSGFKEFYPSPQIAGQKLGGTVDEVDVMGIAASYNEGPNVTPAGYCTRMEASPPSKPSEGVTDWRDERISILEREAVAANSRLLELEGLYSDGLTTIVELKATIKVKDTVQLNNLERLGLLECEANTTATKLVEVKKMYSETLVTISAMKDELDKLNTEKMKHAEVVDSLTTDIARLEKKLADSHGVKNALSASLQRAVDAKTKLEGDMKQLKQALDQRTEEYNKIHAEIADYALRYHESEENNKVLMAESSKKDIQLEELSRSASGASIAGADVLALVDYSSSPSAGVSSRFAANNHGGNVGTPLKPTNLFSGPSVSTPGSSCGSKPPLYPSVKKEVGQGGTPPLVRQGSVTRMNSQSPQYSTPSTIVGAIPHSEAVINSDSPVSEAVKIARKMEKEALAVVQKEGATKESAIVVESVDGTRASRIRNMKLNRKCEAAKLTPVHMINWIAGKFRLKEDSETILRVNTSSLSAAALRLGDMELIINHQRYNDSIIDTWALLLITDISGGQKLKDTRSTVCMKPFIFSSCVWQYAARCNIRESYSEATISFIDNKIPTAVMHENWIIPINTSGDKCPLTVDGDHWTLLHYNTRKNIWTFFNSIAPPIEQDYHYHKATILMDYIEQSVRVYCNSSGLNLPVATCRSATTRNCNIPQQSKASLECGPIVCYLIEMLIHGKEFGSRSWTNAAGGEYRSHMVKSFYQAIMRTTPDEI